MATTRSMAAAATLAALAAPAHGADLTVGGQLRPRWELRDSGVRGLDATAHTGMRARVHVAATLGGGTRAFVQLQDVRIWGEEANTLGDFSADHLDLHQGWVAFTDLGGTGAEVRLGRQEISFGGQRLVGAVDWTNQGRSFDAARVTLRRGLGAIDLVGATLAEPAAPATAPEGAFLGAYATLAPLAGGELYALRNTMDPGTDQWTLGARQPGTLAGLEYRLEGAWQTGERDGADVEAHFVGARLGRDLGRGRKVTLWYDLLSGDDDPADGEVRVFDTLFATNHKFYGYADLFLAIPAHTGGRGLQDLALKTAARVGAIDLQADAHAFRAAAAGGLDSGRFGEELDLTVRGDGRGATFTAGASWVSPAAAWAAVGGPTDDALFVYAMADVRF